MCDKVKTALDVIRTQKGKSLTKEVTLMLFQKDIEDAEKMGTRMTNIEKRMESLEGKMDKVLQLLENRPKTLFEKILLLKDHKLFWISIIVTLLIIGGLLGVPTTGFHGLISLGG